MLENISTFIKHSPPEVAAVFFVSFLVGLSFAMLPMIWKKPKSIIILVWIGGFLAFFILAASNIGKEYRISQDVKKEMCNVYKDSRYDESTHTCYLKYISKNNIPIEIELKNHSFKVIKQDK